MASAAIVKQGSWKNRVWGFLVTSNGITWSKLVPISITVIGMSVAASAWMVEIHDNKPHNGAVHREEYIKDIQHIKELLHADNNSTRARLDRLESKLDSIFDRLKGM